MGSPTDQQESNQSKASSTSVLRPSIFIFYETKHFETIPSHSYDCEARSLFPLHLGLCFVGQCLQQLPPGRPTSNINCVDNLSQWS
jgi:hypothetical protein